MLSGAIRKQTLEFLKTHHTVVLATASGEGEPQAAVMYYVVDDDFTFYIVTHWAGKKIQNLRQNGRVALVVGFGPERTTVQAGGVAHIIEDAETDTLLRKTVMLQLLQKIKISLSDWPIMKTGEHKFVVLKIEPLWLVWLNLENGDRSINPDAVYHKII